MAKISVLIADDDPELAGALVDTVTATSDLQLVAVAGDTSTTIEAAERHRPDVVLMDVKMPGGGGVVATAAVLAQVPGISVVALSAHEDQATALQMVEAGAVGYIVKGMPQQEILDAIRRAKRGQFSMPADLACAAVQDLLRQLRQHIESETGLRSSEGRLHDLLDAVPDALVMVTPDGTIELANSTTQRMFGYGAGELLGQSVHVLVPERFRQAHEKAHRDFTDHARTRQMDFGLQIVGRRKNGSEFPVQVTLGPIKTAAGLVILTTIRDGTESAEAEDAQRRGEVLLRGILESAPDAMVVTDARGRIQVVNSQTEQLFGYPREQLIGQAVEVLVPEPVRGIHTGHRSKYLNDPQRRPMGRGLDLQGRRRDGTEFPVDVSLSPLQTAEGLLVIAAVRDVTDRKLAERQMAMSLELAERRRLMAHLVRVQEEERRKIAGDIHDDSIQAMTAASLRLQQLRRQLTDTRQIELLTKLDDSVRESITRLRRLMFDLRPVTLDQAGLGAALRELLERAKQEGGFEYSLDDRLPDEPSRDVRIEIYRIVQEALVNVRKHARARSVRIELRRTDEGSHIHFTDDGSGFDIAGASRWSGHLGLVAMRERAQIAGGWFTIDSRVGGGTTIDFWLPDSPG